MTTSATAQSNTEESKPQESKPQESKPQESKLQESESQKSGPRAAKRPRAGAGAALAFLVGLGGTVGAAVTAPASGSPSAAEVQAIQATGVAPTDGVATPAPAPPVADAPAAAPPAPPSDGELHPVAIVADQQRFVPSAEQFSNARAIVDVGQSMGLPPRAWVIAVATALQESSLHNVGYLGARNDHDSLGLFQQRPSAGWGTPEQVTDPVYAATAFYNRLGRVRDWPSLPLTIAAQKVQVSAYPDRYARHESEAGDIVRALYGVGPFAPAPLP